MNKLLRCLKRSWLRSSTLLLFVAVFATLQLIFTSEFLSRRVIHDIKPDRLSLQLQYGSTATIQQITSFYEGIVTSLVGERESFLADCRNPRHLQDFVKTRYARLEEVIAFDDSKIDTTDPNYRPPKEQNRTHYFIALNLRNNQKVLGTFGRELIKLVDFLGRSNVFVSIFENDSSDNTKLILEHLRDVLLFMKVPHSISLSTIKSDYKHRNRIEVLAEYRNLAIEPMFSQPDHYDKIIFMNDVFYCFEDVLELIHQSDIQDADMTCAFDYWEYRFRIYDVWVDRTLSGNIIREWFYQGSFNFDPPSRSRYEVGLPIQVYSCWNGIVVLNSEPFYEKGVRFRRSDTTINECAASECKLIAKDFWSLGYGKIMMSPLVRLVYESKYFSMVREDKFKAIDSLRHFLQHGTMYKDNPDKAKSLRTKKTKSLKLRLGGIDVRTHWLYRMLYFGWIHEPEWLDASNGSELIEWQTKGPDEVVCYPMEGVDNPDADFNRPIIEKMNYTN